MSSQTRLTDIPGWKRLDNRGAEYTAADGHTEQPRAPVENPQACQNCSQSLNETVRRVIGDNQDVVWECPHCEDTNRDGFLASANPAGSERETREVRDGGRMEGP